MVSFLLRVASSVCAVVWIVTSASFVMADDGNESEELSRPRRPISLELIGDLLFVANRDTGTISTLDAPARSVLAESSCGRRLSDLAKTPDGRFLLATDEADDRLILLSYDSTGAVRVITRADVAQSPVGLHVDSRHGTVSVASLWAHRVTTFHIAHGKLQRVREIDLPFAPRLQSSTPDGKTLLVCGSFGGAIVAIDYQSGVARSLRSIDGHNIRGIGVDPTGQRLFLAHQTLNQRVPTTRSRIFWGTVVSNLLRSVPLDRILDDTTFADTARANDATQPVPVVRWSLFPLGDPGKAAGDPGRFVFHPDGTMLLLSEGVDELFVIPRPSEPATRVRVGDRPADILLTRDGRIACIANTFSDTISFVDVESRSIVEQVSLGEARPPSAAERGEAIFRDAGLSLDGWASCNSCHTDGHTNGLLNDNFSDDTEGTPKRILSLLGTGPTNPWGWIGTKPTLDVQVFDSVRTTMRRKEDPKQEDVDAVIAFLGALTPPPSILAARGEIDSTRVEAGRQVFEKQNCARCHPPPLYSTQGVFRVGIEDEAGREYFNPPSLLGVSQRRTYFHDGRAKSLREVFEKHRHPKGDELETAELSALLYFLRSL